jgi:hypothetical protein
MLGYGENPEHIQNGFIEMTITIFAATGIEFYDPLLEENLTVTGRQRVYWTVQVSEEEDTYEEEDTGMRHMVLKTKLDALAFCFWNKLTEHQAHHGKDWPEKAAFKRMYMYVYVCIFLYVYVIIYIHICIICNIWICFFRTSSASWTRLARKSGFQAHSSHLTASGMNQKKPKNENPKP